MKLLEQQLELQKSSYKKIEASQKFLEKGKILKYISTLSTTILELKRNSFQEVLKRIIRNESNKYLKILDVNLKNIENYITTYLSNEIIYFIENNRKWKFSLFDKFQCSNQNFNKINKKIYERMLNYTLDVLDDNLEFINTLKEINHVSSFALYPLSSKQISYTLLSEVIKIENFDNDDEDNTANSKQNIGDNIANAIWNTLVYRYLIPIKKKSLEDIEEDIWDPKIKQQIAQDMITDLIKINILEEYSDEEKNKNFKYLKLNSKFKVSLNKIEKELIEKVNVTFKPMIVKPLEWNDIDDGGFLKNEESSIEHINLKLIKASNKKERMSVKEKKGKIPKEVLSAINHIQNTEFKINKDMLRVFTVLSKKLKRKANSIDSKYHKKKKIEKQGDKQIESEILYEMAKYKNSFDRILEIANEFKNYNKIYFVWNMDFRGRIYPVQSLLNPQAGDISKSLLLFASEKKLTNDGVKWFKIHGANLYGEVDKEPFENRIKWIEDHEQDILNSANYYETELFWKKASDPFQFLSFCFEYKKYLNNKESFETSIPVAIDGSNNGLQHISTLLRDIKSAKEVNVLPNGENIISDIYKIIAEQTKKQLKKEKEKFEKTKSKYIFEDGIYYKEEEKDILDERTFARELIELLRDLDTDNIGNKNISTVLDLDEKNYKEAYITYIKRLEKLHKKQPSKERMKKRIINELEDDVEELDKDIKNGIVIEKKNKYYKKETQKIFVEASLISEIEGKINRSFVKSAVMTDSYGASTKSKGKKLKEKIETLNIMKDDKVLFKFSQYLAKIIDSIIDKEIKSSEKYKKWISNVAKKISDTEKQIEWKTPLGFIVSQNEYKTKKEILSTDLGKITIQTYTDEINFKKHKTAIAPNYIHSLDATHLFKTINSLHKQGVKDFITIHDSFATHANDLQKLSDTLKEEFIDLYSQNILEDFVDNINKKYKLDIEKNIPYINEEFNIEEIRQSNYFFS